MRSRFNTSDAMRLLFCPSGSQETAGRIHTDDLILGFAAFKAFPIPVIVPPLPMPATKASISPAGISFKISLPSSPGGPPDLPDFEIAWG